MGACPLQRRWKWLDGVLPVFLISKGCLFWAAAQRFFPHSYSKSEWHLAKHTWSLPSEGKGIKKHGWSIGSMDKVLRRLSEVISWRITLGKIQEILLTACQPSSRDDGASRGFSQGAVPGWGFSRDRTGSSGRLLWCHGSQVSMDVAWGSASLLSSHGRGIKPQDASKKNSRGLSRGVAGNPGFPRLVPMTSGSLAGFL